MKWLYNLKLSAKLGLAFGMCLSLSLLIGAVAFVRMAQMNQIAANLNSQSIQGLINVIGFRGAIKNMRIDEYRNILETSQSGIAATESDIQSDDDAATKALARYAAASTSSGDDQEVSNLQADWKAYESLNAEMIPLSEKNANVKADALMDGAMHHQFNVIAGEADWLVNFNADQAAISVAAGNSAFNIARITIVSLLIFSLLVGSLAAISITRYITGTMSLISQRLHSLSTVCIYQLGVAISAMEHGDLTVGITPITELLSVNSKDEFGNVSKLFNDVIMQTKNSITSFGETQTSLSAILQQIRSSAIEVSGTSQSLASTSQQIGATTQEISATMIEVAQASEQSSRGATEVAKGSSSQAAAVTEGAGLVKQLAASMHGVAKDAKKAESLTTEATVAAQSGAESVRETVEGMHSIGKTIDDSSHVIQTLSESSHQIGTIVKTIEEIADQTNLLALNAAIEAARAGDAGRGFAVVADEVRKLAERSRSATEEIGGLIATVQDQTASAVRAMEDGVREVSMKTSVAEKAGIALTNIQTAVKSVTAQINNIAVAAEEMTASSDEVARSIADIAAVVEESSAAAEEMSASAEQVSNSVQTVSDTTAQAEAGLAHLVHSADRLAEISTLLLDQVAQFTILEADSKATATGKSSGKPNLRISRAA
jgi:methyl-accepting chemotaxis protein